MKRILFVVLIILFSFNSYSQFRWEVSGGITSTTLQIDTSGDTGMGYGFYLNTGYGYVTGYQAKTSFVFSLEYLQRNSTLTDLGNIRANQMGFNPKFRFLFNSGDSVFRPYVNVGPTFRVNLSMEVGSEKLEKNSYEQMVIGGLYGVGFSLMTGDAFDILAEAGAMNDFTNNLKHELKNDPSVVIHDGTKSKFFDFYLRIGLRFRMYNRRR